LKANNLMENNNGDKRGVEIRPGVSMAYEDHWFGEPWTTPETVVMVHGNSESSRAWTCWVPHLARHYRVVRPDLPGYGQSPEPSGYGWSAPELASAPRNAANENNGPGKSCAAP